MLLGTCMNKKMIHHQRVPMHHMNDHLGGVMPYLLGFCLLNGCNCRLEPICYLYWNTTLAYYRSSLSTWVENN